MSFANLESDSDTSDVDYTFRADVVDADGCEGGGMGNDRYMYRVDEDPEVRTGSISTSCAPGDYTVEVSISSPADVELASATADFTVATPAQQQPPPEPPASTDATLSGLTLSGVDFTFASATTSYDVNVANEVEQTTVTATANDGGATYAVKLGGVTDEDRVILLDVGSNVITVEVTAEDGNTARTYTVTVTRAEPPLSTDATLSGLTLSGVDFTFASATTSYDVNVANGVDETTVTATANDGGATYAIKLGGVDRRRQRNFAGSGQQRHHRRGHRRGREHRQDLHRNRHPRRAAALDRRYAEWTNTKQHRHRQLRSGRPPSTPPASPMT